MFAHVTQHEKAFVEEGKQLLKQLRETNVDEEYVFVLQALINVRSVCCKQYYSSWGLAAHAQMHNDYLQSNDDVLFVCLRDLAKVLWCSARVRFRFLRLSVSRCRCLRTPTVSAIVSSATISLCRTSSPRASSMPWRTAPLTLCVQPPPHSKHDHPHLLFTF